MFPYLRTVEQFFNDCDNIKYETKCTINNRDTESGNYSLDKCLTSKSQKRRIRLCKCGCYECNKNKRKTDCLNCKKISVLVNWLIRSVDRSNWGGRDAGKLGSIDKGEIKAWCHSLNYHMYKVLKELSTNGIAYNNLAIGLEYYVDNRAYEGETGIRADVLIGGYGYWEDENIEEAKPHKRIVVIEIKQWGDDNQVNYPIEQVENYCKKLRLSIGDHADSQRDPIEIIPCVFMHEAKHNKKPIGNYKPYKKFRNVFCYGNSNIPVFMKDSEGAFADYLEEIFNDKDIKHNGKEVFKALKNRIKTFSTDELSALLTCKQEKVEDAINHLHPDQYYAYNRIKRQLLLYKLNKDGIFNEVIKGAYNSVCDDEEKHLNSCATTLKSSYIQELHDTLRISRRDSFLRKVYLCIILEQKLYPKGEINKWKKLYAGNLPKNQKKKKEEICCEIKKEISKHEMLNDYYHDLVNFGINFSKKQKPADFVFGGPGSGKTLLTALLLRYCVDQGISVAVLYAANSPIEFLNKGLNNIRVETFIKSVFWDDIDYKNIDVIVFDEAHLFGKNRGKIKEKVTNRFPLKFCIFLLDQKQFINKITKEGSDKILEYKNEVDKKATELHLWSQFRCGCDEGYITWVEQLLGISDAELRLQGSQKDYNSRLYLDDLDMDVEVMEECNDLKEIEKKISEKLLDNVKCVTGQNYLNWLKSNNNDNKKKNKQPVIKEEIVNEILNIHNAQGKEFDKVLVIIGDEFEIHNGKLTVKQRYNKIWGVQTTFNNKDKKYIKNEYRVLLTRGLKKCYILCVDPKVREVVASKLKRSKQKGAKKKKP